MARETFGVRLARLREKRGLSQAELAKASGIQQSMLSMLEAGQRKGDYVRGGTLMQMARALDVSMEYLLQGRERRKRPTPAADDVEEVAA